MININQIIYDDSDYIVNITDDNDNMISLSFNNCFDNSDRMILQSNSCFLSVGISVDFVKHKFNEMIQFDNFE